MHWSRCFPIINIASSLRCFSLSVAYFAFSFTTRLRFQAMLYLLSPPTCFITLAIFRLNWLKISITNLCDLLLDSWTDNEEANKWYNKYLWFKSTLKFLKWLFQNLKEIFPQVWSNSRTLQNTRLRNPSLIIGPTSDHDAKIAELNQCIFELEVDLLKSRNGVNHTNSFWLKEKPHSPLLHMLAP